MSGTTPPEPSRPHRPDISNQASDDGAEPKPGQVTINTARRVVLERTGDDETQIELIKKDGTFRFRFASGDETQLMKTLLDMAHDPASSLDIVDAAMLSQRIGGEIGHKLQRTLGG